ncbi:MAG: energy-coupling factor transport system substrate-specific component [Chloroflexota bacterium]|nr:energy-coupling factor transport system substrate-specific component [Chloroflexota bacterium]
MPVRRGASPVLALVSLAGLVLFAWPFLGLGLPDEVPSLALAAAAAGVHLLVGYGPNRLDNRRLALLAAIAALDAGMRLALVNGIAGFTPIFFLLLCAGYVFGPSFGFLAGSTAMLVSALVTGGVGPWLPYEMFAAGWVGAAAGLVLGGRRDTVSWPRLVLLATAGAALGYAYGAATDVYDWSIFYRGHPTLGWEPGMGAAEALARFGRFYLATSLAWDTFRAVGNAAMVLALGAPVLAAMSRFRARFTLVIEEVEPRSDVSAPAAAPRASRV